MNYLALILNIFASNRKNIISAVEVPMQMVYETSAIITSKLDPASRNIKAHLLEMYPFCKTDESFDGERIYALGDIKIYTPNKHPIECEEIDIKINADLFCFATKHKAVSGKPSLSVHVPGNWGKAELGGKDGQVCSCPASAIRTAFLELSKQWAGTEYEITLEATHHGPLLEKPCFFIEIGSDETQWSREEPAIIIAKTIMASLQKCNETFPTVMVLGGGHYNQLGNKVLQRTNFAVGHICAKHSLAKLDIRLLNQAIERTAEKVDCIVLDWKGLGDQKENIKKLSEESKVGFVRSNKFLNNEE
jgi:D-aminoacyl-tRNA deacylase